MGACVKRRCTQGRKACGGGGTRTRSGSPLGVFVRGALVLHPGGGNPGLGARAQPRAAQPSAPGFRCPPPRASGPQAGRINVTLSHTRRNQPQAFSLKTAAYKKSCTGRIGCQETSARRQAGSVGKGQCFQQMVLGDWTAPRDRGTPDPHYACARTGPRSAPQTSTAQLTLQTGEKRAKPARPRATPRALHAGPSRRGAQLLALGLRGQSQPAAPAKGAAGRPAAGRGCVASPCGLRAGPPQEPGVGRPLEGGNGFVEV